MKYNLTVKTLSELTHEEAAKALEAFKNLDQLIRSELLEYLAQDIQDLSMTDGCAYEYRYGYRPCLVHHQAGEALYKTLERAASEYGYITEEKAQELKSTAKALRRHLETVKHRGKWGAYSEEATRAREYLHNYTAHEIGRELDAAFNNQADWIECEATAEDLAEDLKNCFIDLAIVFDGNGRPVELLEACDPCEVFEKDGRYYRQIDPRELYYN